MPARESHPISDTELGGHVSKAEALLEELKKVKREDILTVLQGLSPEEKYRPLPAELDLFYAIRHGLCLYFYFHNLLTERTGLQQELDKLNRMGLAVTTSTQQKREFISAYGLFVMASAIVMKCERMLKGKDPAKLAHLEVGSMELVLGRGLTQDSLFALVHYVDALKKRDTDGRGLVQNVDDTIAVTRDYWKAVVAKVQTIAKGFPAELLALVGNTTFRHDNFAVTGFQAEDRKEVKVVTWAPVEPQEVIGDQDVTLILARLADRLVFYDPVLKKNPFVYFGGLLESILLDGHPGTGKTHRMRMLMTSVARGAEEVGLPYVFKSITGDQVKSEWYGRAAQLIKELLSVAQDPLTLALIFVDDIDLLIKGDRNDPGTSGGDLDIMKALMDFFSGTGTNYIGNYLAVAATNKPTATDEALRQRFVYRAVIKGSETWEDFMDVAALELRDFAKTGLLQIGEGKVAPLKRPLPTTLAETYGEELRKKYSRRKGATWEDVGRLCVELHKKDPKFTNRPVKNAIQVAKAKAADFEVPKEWFTNPAVFRAKSWEERLAMTKELFGVLTTEMVMMALENQFEVEIRYEREAHERKVQDLVEELRVREEALRRASVKS